MSENKDEIKQAISNYYKKEEQPNVVVLQNNNPNPNMPAYDMNSYGKHITDQIDTDLVVGFDTVKLPSKGIFYKNKICD